jgi:FkbM family methyltransferase
MRVKQIAGKIINIVLGKFGYELRPVDMNFSMQSALSRRAASGLEIRTVIDVGASNGSWSKMTKQYFPNAFYFLIEANDVHAQGLLDFKSQNPNVDYVLAAAGDSVGEIFFDVKDPFGGQASHSPATPDYITVPVTTIDEQVTKKSLHPPFLLKLDTHGFEVPILKGARETLKKTELIVIETYNFKLSPDGLRFWEMCSHLEAQGFSPIDLCDPMHRPTDHAFWQMDLFFVPSTNREFESNSYT